MAKAVQFLSYHTRQRTQRRAETCNKRRIKHIQTTMAHLAIIMLPLLCAALVAAAPKPLHRTATAAIHEPVLAKIGDYVARVPTAISHQSSTIVHDHADVAVAPIVAPAIKTSYAEIHSPFAYTAAAAPAPLSSSSPLLRSFAASPTHFTPYAFAPFPFNMFAYYSPFAAYESGLYRQHV